MASKTSATENKRRRRKLNAGKKRKARNRTRGTTPPRKDLFGDK